MKKSHVECTTKEQRIVVDVVRAVLGCYFVVCNLSDLAQIARPPLQTHKNRDTVAYLGFTYGAAIMYLHVVEC